MVTYNELSRWFDDHGSLVRSRRVFGAVAAIAVFAYFTATLYAGLVKEPGPHDNDWPLLMWIAKHARLSHLEGLAIGHYGFLQLLLVRLLEPLTHSTLVAAKVLNTVATVVTGICAFVIVRRLTLRMAWAMVAAVAFLLWPTVYYEAQSEFGDPLALAFFALGLATLVLAARDSRFVIAGLWIGIAGCTRLHMQTFGWAMVLVVVGLEISRNGATLSRSLKRTGVFTAGMLIGQMPVFIVNLIVHHALSAPSTSGFVGSALFGLDAYDVAGTHLAHPMSEVLREHKLELLTMIADRLVSVPLAIALLMLLGGLGVLLKRNVYAGTIWLLAVGYYVGFVTPAWGITYRLLLPVVFLSIISCTLALHELTAARDPRLSHAIAVACVMLSIGNLRVHKGWIRAERANVNNYWATNSAIERLLREHGMHDARQVFALDWWTHPVSDPDFQPYYTFGFRNHLDPEFAAERPNPRAYVDDPTRFIAFLEAHGVSYLVLTPDSPFPTLNELCNHDALPGGFTRIGRVDQQILYAKED